MNCGEKIARLRKQNDMTQSELGDALNVTYQAVSKWERGESQPDFDTISRIAKLFQVPISHFEDNADGTEVEYEQNAAPAPDVIGMCVQCGKIVRDGDAAVTSPKLICKACDDLNKKAEQKRVQDERQAKDEAERQARNAVQYEKSKLARRRNLALIFAVIPAAVIFIALSVVALLPANRSMFGFIFGGGCVLAACAYTFTAQMIWDGVVREICTGGGHVISLPGIIFSLSPDGLLFLILTKIFLTLIAGIVFVGSIILCFLAAFVISPFTFVPSLLFYNRNISRVGR